MKLAHMVAKIYYMVPAQEGLSQECETYANLQQ